MKIKKNSNNHFGVSSYINVADNYGFGVYQKL